MPYKPQPAVDLDMKLVPRPVHGRVLPTVVCAFISAASDHGIITRPMQLVSYHIISLCKGHAREGRQVLHLPPIFPFSFIPSLPTIYYHNLDKM